MTIPQRSRTYTGVDTDSKLIPDLNGSDIGEMPVRHSYLLLILCLIAVGHAIHNSRRRSPGFVYFDDSAYGSATAEHSVASRSVKPVYSPGEAGMFNNPVIVIGSDRNFAPIMATTCLGVIACDQTLYRYRQNASVVILSMIPVVTNSTNCLTIVQEPLLILGDLTVVSVDRDHNPISGSTRMCSNATYCIRHICENWRQFNETVSILTLPNSPPDPKCRSLHIS